jgi:hypothetical protein
MRILIYIMILLLVAVWAFAGIQQEGWVLGAVLASPILIVAIAGLPLIKPWEDITDWIQSADARRCNKEYGATLENPYFIPWACNEEKKWESY